MQDIMVPRVSVIVPCYNEEETIVELLTSIAAQDYPLELLDIVIADGMSEDGTRAKINQFIEAHSNLSVQLIDNPGRSIPLALNEAIAASSGDIIVRLDAHSVPAEDYISRCVQVLEETGAANAGGIWMIRPGANSPIARSIANAAAHPLGAGDARYRTGGESGSVDTVPFGAFRREWLDRVGPFNEALKTNEDYEYNVRLREAGGMVWFDPSIRSIYYARSSLPQLARQYWRYGFWKVRMLSLFPATLRWRQALPPLFMFVSVVLGLAGIFSDLFLLLLGVQWATYMLVIFLTGLFIAFRSKDLVQVFVFPLAIMTMHLSWGTGFLVSLGKFLVGERHE
jgi:glycosyltransferase involved in cell wall biosynthesis